MREKVLLLIANGSRARLFEGSRRYAGLVELSDLVAPEHRLHERDRLADRPGRARGNAGGGRHGVDSAQDLTDESLTRFARETVAALEQAYAADHYYQVTLCAAPAMLGHLRQHIPPQLAKHIQLELDRDWTQMTAAQLETALQQATSLS